jgi:UDP-N-acetylmuramyl pentapeptide synthase
MKKNIIKFLYNFLAFFTRIYLKRTDSFIIWITWSIWKTSSRMIIYQILNKFLKNKKVYSSPKNFNSEIWIILSIFQIEKYTPSIIYIVKLCFKHNI